MKKKILSLVLAGALLVGAAPVMANAGEWTKENSKWYYNDNGAWKKGWAKIDNVWYYFNSNAEMHTGWLNDGGTWYYLNSDGSMVNYNTTIDGKAQRFSSEGVWLGEAYTSYNNKSSRTVYWVQKGKSYHFDINCRTLARSKNIYEGPLSDCPKSDPCDWCAN